MPGSNSVCGGKLSDRTDLLPPRLLDRLGGLELIARTIVLGFVQGLHRAPFRGAGLDFAGHRAYQQGDDLRHVDWRLFGRTDRYYIREYREDANLQAWILIDATLSMDFADPGGVSKFRYGVMLAAALAHIMLETGDAVGVASFSDVARLLASPRSRRGHLHDLLIEMERIRPAGAASSALAVDHVSSALRRRGRLVLISDLLADDDGEAVIAALARLRARGDEVIVLRPLTAAEAGRRPLDSARYYDPESPDVAVPTGPLADAGLADRVDDYYTRLGRRLRNHGVEYVPLWTGDPLENALRRWIAARAAGPAR